MTQIIISKLIKEEQEKKEAQILTPDQKKQFLETVSNYNSYRNKLKTETDLVQMANELCTIADTAQSLALNETDEWFDTITINRNMKELKKINELFNSSAKDAKLLQDRMLSLYEDMGHILGRYFDIKTNKVS